MERAVPGAVHALRLDTFKGHQRVDIIFNRDRHGGGRAADDRGGDADAGAPAQEDAPRSGRRHSAAAATAASGSAPARRPTPPAFTGERQAPQPAQQQAMEAPAPSEEPPLCTLFGEAELPTPDASASGADGAARATVAEAMQESVPPGPAFCWPPPPLPSGQPPREPRTAVGRAVKYIREGVLAVAAEVDGDAAYDAENYYEGKFR